MYRESGFFFVNVVLHLFSTRFFINSVSMIHSRTLYERKRCLTKSASRHVASRQLSRRRRGLVRNGGTSLFSGQVFSEFSKQTQIVLNYLASKFDSVDPQSLGNDLPSEVQKCIQHNIHPNQSNEYELEKYKVKFAFNCPSTSSITAYYVPNKQSTQSAIQKANSEYNAWLSKCSWGGSFCSLTGTTVSAATSLVDSAVSTVTRLGSDAVSSANTYFNTKDLSKIPSTIVVQKSDVKNAIKEIAKKNLSSLSNCPIKDMHIASDKKNGNLKNAVLKYIPDENRLFIEIPVSQGQRWLSKKLNTASILQLPTNSYDQKNWSIDEDLGEVNWTCAQSEESTALSNILVIVTSKLDTDNLYHLSTRQDSPTVLGGKRLRARTLHNHHRTRRRHAKHLATHTNRAPKKHRRVGGSNPVSLVKKTVTDLAGDVQRDVRHLFTDNTYRTFKLDSATASTIDATFDTAFQHVSDHHKLVYKDLLTVYQQYYAVREGNLFLTQENDITFLTFCAKRLQYVNPKNVKGKALIGRAMKQDTVFRNFILEGTNQCTTSVTDIWKNMGEKAGTMFKEPFPFTLNDSSGIQADLPVKGIRVPSPADVLGDYM